MIVSVQPTAADPFTFQGVCPFCRTVAMVHNESGLCGVCLARERAKWVHPSDPMAPRPSFVPVAVGDGFGGTGRTVLCARDGMTGPCWGRSGWYETRDLLTGRCQRVFCQGHSGAIYRPEVVS